MGNRELIAFARHNLFAFLLNVIGMLSFAIHYENTPIQIYRKF